MTAWRIKENEILPIDEVERREVIRAITVCGGDVLKAAEALRMGRTTIYRKLRQWGCTIENRLLINQASVLGMAPPATRETFRLNQPSHDHKG